VRQSGQMELWSGYDEISAVKHANASP
jgi:hypothetical protein